MIPASETGFGINNYTFRPAGNDTYGNVCEETYPQDYSLCNDNYGGIEVVSIDSEGNPSGRLDVLAYKLRVSKGAYNSI